MLYISKFAKNTQSLDVSRVFKVLFGFALIETYAHTQTQILTNAQHINNSPTHTHTHTHVQRIWMSCELLHDTGRI